MIEPAQPDVVYVPTYNPSEVYGTWPYADLPPVYYAPPPGYGYPVWRAGRRDWCSAPAWRLQPASGAGPARTGDALVAMAA